jgi:SulP family sulfate permease
MRTAWRKSVALHGLPAWDDAPIMGTFFKPTLFGCLRAGYSRQDLLADVFAGLLVAVVALPLSMALAIASGANPEQGLWTAIIAGGLISLLGGSRVQIGGPAGAFVGLCAAAVNQFGFPGLALATVMAGILMIFLGSMRLGRVISFIPIPVVIGFTTGIAVILASTQVGPMLGLPEPDKPFEHLHERLVWVWKHLGAARWEPAAICLATMAVILGARRIDSRIPGGLVAIAVAGLAVWALDWESSGRVSTIASNYPKLAADGGLPLFSWPSLTWFAPDPRHFPHGVDWLKYLADLTALALAIALLGSIESLLSAVVADGMTGHRHDSNTELVGQGIANIVAPLFGCLPATGVIARTSANVRAGARTPVAGLVHAGAILLMLVALAPVIIHVPVAALAGILLVVCWYMAELRHWPHILKAGRSDAWLLPIAFCLTAFVGLTWAILTGVTLAMFFFVQRMSENMQVERQDADDDPLLASRPPPDGVQVYEVRGPFFFGAATMLRDLDDHLQGKVKVLILRLRNVPFIDATAGFALRELMASCKARGIALVLAEVHTRPLHDLQRLGLDDEIGEDRLLGSLGGALDRGGELAAQPSGRTTASTPRR